RLYPVLHVDWLDLTQGDDALDFCPLAEVFDDGEVLGLCPLSQRPNGFRVGVDALHDADHLTAAAPWRWGRVIRFVRPGEPFLDFKRGCSRRACAQCLTHKFSVQLAADPDRAVTGEVSRLLLAPLRVASVGGQKIASRLLVEHAQAYH